MNIRLVHYKDKIKFDQPTVPNDRTFRRLLRSHMIPLRSILRRCHCPERSVCKMTWPLFFLPQHLELGEKGLCLAKQSQI